jgi:hypothetical protein
MNLDFPILFGRQSRTKGLDAAIAAIDVDALCAEYAKLREDAPRRSRSGKSYFVGHSGIPSSASSSNRLEEHTAIALVNLDRFWPLPGGGWVRLLDYQVPLKAKRADARVGKIDLLGVSDRGRLVVVELKVHASQARGRSDSPLTALMEGLRYAAIVEANFAAIASEARQCFGVNISSEPPILALLATRSWWRRWIDTTAAGAWGVPFRNLLDAVRTRTGIVVECLALEDVRLICGLAGRAPRLEPAPTLHSVRHEEITIISDDLPPLTADSEAAARYKETVERIL